MEEAEITQGETKGTDGNDDSQDSQDEVNPAVNKQKNHFYNIIKYKFYIMH